MEDSLIIQHAVYKQDIPCSIVYPYAKAT
jgi:hypothetical protein